jgi:hypothetical protein
MEPQVILFEQFVVESLGIVSKLEVQAPIAVQTFKLPLRNPSLPSVWAERDPLGESKLGLACCELILRFKRMVLQTFSLDA